ncbi:DUF815 domain-containing protein [Pseudomonas sp. NA-150]|uniref:DUF815 domain-containing protein n=1 Tax=Pseudomonas sp. NA-150 TaxID=3367525 RepID=UPI0037C97BCB
MSTDKRAKKFSLSDRLSLWISFCGFYPDEYLTAVNKWMATYGVPEDKIRSRSCSCDPMGTGQKGTVLSASPVHGLAAYGAGWR